MRLKPWGTDNNAVQIFPETFQSKAGSSYLERGAGTLNLDVTPAGRVPATDGQVTGQVLVPYCLVIDGCHLSLCQTKSKLLHLNV